jgi:hypothetical protein
MTSSSPKPRARATEKDREARLETVLSLLARGIPKSKILQVLIAHYGISERQAKRYLSEARELEAALGEGMNAKSRGVLANRFEFLFQQAVEKGDLKTARDILNSHSKLLQLPNQTGGIKAGHDPANPSPAALGLSPELEASLQRLAAANSELERNRTTGQ